MENEWLDIACINNGKYIMHGQVSEGVQIEQTLTQEQKSRVDDLMFEQERELRSLLKSFLV